MLPASGLRQNSTRFALSPDSFRDFEDVGAIVVGPAMTGFFLVRSGLRWRGAGLLMRDDILAVLTVLKIVRAGEGYA